MTDENKPPEGKSGLGKFWNSLDKNIQIILVGGAVVLVLYYLMSLLQQCKRERSHSWCYMKTSW